MTPDQRAFLKAAKTGNIAALKSLLKCDNALLSTRDKDGSSALHCAAWKGQEQVVAFLLDQGIAVDDQNENGHWGTTPLCAAAHADNKEVAELLLSRGAQINFRDPLNQLTALGHTKIHHAKRVAKLLVEHGGKE